MWWRSQNERHRSEVGQRQRLAGVGPRHSDGASTIHSAELTSIDGAFSVLWKRPMAGLIIEREHDRVPGDGHGGWSRRRGSRAGRVVLDGAGTSSYHALSARRRRVTIHLGAGLLERVGAQLVAARARSIRGIGRLPGVQCRRLSSTSPTLGGTTRRRDGSRSRPSWCSGWCWPRGRSTHQGGCEDQRAGETGTHYLVAPVCLRSIKALSVERPAGVRSAVSLAVVHGHSPVAGT